MKALIKLILSLGLVFLSIFLLMKTTDTLSLERIKQWLSAAQNANLWVVALIVIALLLSDLIISVPTLATVTLSGFFLGHLMGALVSLVGLSLIGIIGYMASFHHGDKVEKWVLKSERDRIEARQSFNQHGLIMILFSRTLPMLPEVCACMAGLTKMRFKTFMLAWTASNLPYVAVATYAGSISSIDNPVPAIVSAICIYLCLAAGWFILQRTNKNYTNPY